jgi:YD repeat-containing protein
VFQYDAFGRVWRELTAAADGSDAIRETDYDGAGRKSQVSELESTPTHFTRFTYDGLGRVVSVTAPDNSVTTTTYNGIATTTRTQSIATSATATSPVNGSPTRRRSIRPTAWRARPPSTSMRRSRALRRRCR